VTIMTFRPDTFSGDLEASCDASAVGVLVSLVLAGLSMTFGGYLLYKSCLAFLGFTILFAFEAINGGLWLSRSPSAQTEKVVLVGICCVMWGIAGAFGCVRYTERLQQKLGFTLGAVCGGLLVWGVIFAIKGDADTLLLPDYEGWDLFAIITLALPGAVLFGYLMRNLIKYTIMLATSLFGAGLAIVSMVEAFKCSDADLGPVTDHKMQALFIVILAGMGCALQFFTDSDRKHSTSVVREVVDLTK